LSGCAALLEGVARSGSAAMLSGSSEKRPIPLIYTYVENRKEWSHETFSQQKAYRILIPYIYENSSFNSETEEDLLGAFMDEFGKNPNYINDIMLLNDFEKNELNEKGKLACITHDCYFEVGKKKKAEFVLKISYFATDYKYSIFAQMLDVKSKRVLKSGATHCDANDEASLKAAIHSLIEQVRIDK